MENQEKKLTEKENVQAKEVNKDGSVGALIGSIIVILMIVIGGIYYYWKSISGIYNTQVDQQKVSDESNTENNEGLGADTELEVESQQ